MIRRPPRSTLFPSPPLSRSVTIVHRRDHFRAERILQDRLFKNPKIKVIWDSAIDEICGTDNPGKVTHVDRKSTRLNSSHLVISYAVFCLKKKKQTVSVDRWT